MGAGNTLGFDDLPEGSEVVTSPPQQTQNPEVDVQTPSYSDIPPGAEVQTQPQSFNDLPEGAELAELPAEMPGTLTALAQGVLSAGHQLEESTALAAGTQDPGNEVQSPAAASFELKDAIPFYGDGLPKLAYRIGKSAPSLVGGVSGGIAGGYVSGGNPLAVLGGGALGAAATTAYQEVGGRYKLELSKTPNDVDGAYNRALKSATASGVFSGLAWAAFPALGKWLGDGLKNLVVQGTVVQPTVGAGGQVAQNYLAGDPLSQGVGEAALEASVGTIVPAGGHELVKAGVRKTFSNPKGIEDTTVDPNDIPPPPEGFEYSDVPKGAEVVQSAEEPAVASSSAEPQAPTPLTPSDYVPPEQDARKIIDPNDQQERIFRQQLYDNGLSLKSATGQDVEALQQRRRAILRAQKEYLDGKADKVPPLQEARQNITKGNDQIEDNTDTFDGPPHMDYSESATQLSDILASIKEEVLKHKEQKRDVDIDLATPRFVVDNGSDRILYNSTDLETDLALRQQNGVKPTIHKVDLEMLEPDKISAQYYDLPRWGDKRISAPAEMESSYRALHDPNLFPAQKVELYHQLLEQGLRVMPKPGASFLYGGELFGHQKIDYVPESGRINMPFFFDKLHNTVYGALRPGHIGRTTAGINTKQSTIDLHLVDKDTFVSADPSDVGLLPSTVSNEDYFTWIAASHKDDLTTLKKLAAKGVSVPVEFVDGVPQNTGGGITSKIIAIKELPAGAIKSGYTDLPYYDQNYTALPFVGTTKGIVTVDTKTFRATVKQEAQAHAMGRTLETLQPIINEVGKMFGMKTKPNIRVVAGEADSPRVQTQTGEIVFPTEGFNNVDFLEPQYGDKIKLAQILFHEFGHLITINSWDRLPLDIKGSVIQAHKRAMLNYNISRDATGFMAPRSRQYDASEGYYLTMVEWQAEQFRRWMSSNQTALDITDHYWAGGAAKLKQAIASFSSWMSPKQAQQLFQSDWTFNSWMDYMEYAAREGESPLQMSIKAGSIELEAPVAGDIAQAYNAINDAVGEFKNLIANDILLEVSDAAQISDTIGYGSLDRARVLRLMAGSFAWIKDQKQMSLMAQRIVAHEAFHGIEGILTPGQKALLVKVAKAAGVLPKELEDHYRAGFRKHYEDQGLSKEDAATAAERFVDSEHMAALIESRANGGIHNKVADSFIDKLVSFFKKVGNTLRGYGFNSAEDLIHAFYRGELTRRYNERAARGKQAEVNWQEKVDINKLPKIQTKSGQLSVQHDRLGGLGEGVYSHRYEFYDGAGNKVAFINMDRKYGSKEYEIGFIKVVDPKWYGKGVPAAMLEHVHQDLGQQMKVARFLTRQGKKMVDRMYPGATKYYTWDARQELWASPKGIWDNLREASADFERYNKIKERSGGSEIELATRRNTLRHWERLAETIPEIAKDDPILQHQWAQRDYVMSEFERSKNILASRQNYEASNDISQGPIQDPFSEIEARQAEAAKAKGPFIGYKTNAPEQPSLTIVKRVLGKYGADDPELRPLLHGLNTRADKMGWISKNMLSLRQISYRNKIEALRNYISWTDQMKIRANEWIYRASETAREWDKISDPLRDGLSNLLFWATEMKYRTPQEVRSGIIRHPSAQEIAAEATRLKLDQKTLQLFGRISKDFGDFLVQMESVFTQQIMRRISDPAAQAIAITELQADMQKLRAKPYFPMVRFGEWTITGRDPNNINSNSGLGAVEWFSSYATQAERDAALSHVHKQTGGLLDLQVGKMGEEFTDFMGLPEPLLKRIAAELPNVTPAQKDWIERQAHLMAPEQSFKKRWLQRKGTPGYSLDGVRTYSQYFRSASRYLARLEFIDQMNESIKALEDRAKASSDNKRAKMILDAVKEHAEYIQTPGQDWSNLKAFFTHWMLGANISSAMVNLTQVPMVSYPYLSSLYGERAALKIMTNVGGGFKRTAGFFDRAKDPQFTMAHDEIVRQGRIDIGQAADLGSFSETDRMSRSYTGTGLQRAYRNGAWAIMQPFAQAERLNREITFKTAYDLAMKDKNNPHHFDIITAKNKEYTDLRARTGLHHDEATAFLVAKEAVDRTQGMYDSWERPKFLRGGLKSTLGIFLSYTQQTMFQLWNNPGRLKQALIFGAMYGALGLPGAQNLDELIRALSRKLFGEDFKPSLEARKYIKELAKGTVFSEVAPDLFLHGVSRYSYGLSAFPESWGMPDFDASGRGSMGDLIPGLSNIAKAWGESGADADAWKDMTASAAKDVSGAGFSTFFTMLQMLTAPPYSTDQKKWSKIMPPAVKNAVDAYRMMQEQKETTNQGGALVRFDMKDPNDRATLIAKAIGFQPRALNEKYEQLQEVNSITQFYKAKKLEVTIQLQQAIAQKDPVAVEAAHQALRAFNEENAAAGNPVPALSSQSLLRSLKARSRTKAMQDAGLPPQKSQIPLSMQVKQLWPTVIDERKVK